MNARDVLSPPDATAEFPGVSFVVPLHNGRRWLSQVLSGITAQRTDGPVEIIVVDDGSTDGTREDVERLAASAAITVVHGPRRGAAAAINAGIQRASYPIVCQVDQDVILGEGWLAPLLYALRDQRVAAAQGHYVTAPGARFWARATGRDLEHRYSRIVTEHVDHVCTGNTAYRRSALLEVGLLDEQLGYGYDNDLSYRLAAHGYRLAFCRDARSVHMWREGLRGYFLQQFGVGYGRLDVVRKHLRKAGGDDVSGMLMMLHAPAFLAACAAGAYGALSASAVSAVSGVAILGGLCLERLIAGTAAWRHTGDRTALLFPLTHLVRDAAWGAAIVTWVGRRVLGRQSRPHHSMRRIEPRGDNLGARRGEA